MIKNIKNPRQKNPFKTSTITLLFFLIVILSSVQISAANFDNIKSFDKTVGNYGKITIENWFGIGETIVELELKENTDVCWQDCSAETEIIMYEEGVLIDKVRFMIEQEDESWEEGLIISYEFYLIEGDKKTIYNLGDEVVAGTYYVRLEGKKNYKKTVDWQIISQGKLINEWATWEVGDFITNWDTAAAGADAPSGITTNGTFIWVDDSTDDEIYKFDMDGNFVSKCALNSSNTANNGIWTNSSHMWVVEGTADFVYMYDMNCNDIRRWALDADNSAAVGITSNDTNFFITDTTDKRVYRYLMDGTSLDFFSTVDDEGTAAVRRGVAVDGDFLHLIDGAVARPDIIYKHYLNGTWISNFTATTPNAFSFGIETDGKFIWTIDLDDAEVYRYYNAGELTVTLDSPSNNSFSKDNPLNFDAALSATIGYNLTNTTIQIWDSTGALVNFTTKRLAAQNNVTNFTISNLPIGVLTWNILGCSNITGDTECRFADENFTLNYGIELSDETQETFVYETERQTFSINVTSNINVSDLSANLIYNGTTFSATVTQQNTTTYNVVRILDTPLSGVESRNKSFNWNFTLVTTSGNVALNSIEKTQNITKIIFAPCNTTLTKKYINYTFKDETNDTFIPATITQASIEYYLGGGDVTKTFSAINNSELKSFPYCFKPGTESLKVSQAIAYNKNGFQQRIVTFNETLTNATINRTLMLLPTANGLFVTFQVINTAEQPIGDVFVNVSRNIGGTIFLLGSGTTNDGGAITFFLNPDFSHDFVFEKSGFTILKTSLFPTQTSFTINLGGSAAAITNDDLTRGISYSIKPLITSLVNDTTYEFNFTLSSSFWTVTRFGFVLSSSSGTLFQSITSTDNGGIVLKELNVGNNQSIVMDYFWVINNTYQNASRSWIVFNTAGTDWSIRNFFDDFSTFLSSGIFGLDTFGLNLIIFIIIFVTTGILSFKFGITSPAAISGIIFALVLFFDVGVGLISNPVGAIPNFPTILIGIIFAGFLFKEATIR